MANDPTGTSSSEPQRPSAILAEVLVYAGEQCVSKYSLTHGEYTIGREGSCQIGLDVDGVSRHHARLTFQGYELVIEDLGSANGVFIEGVQISLPTRVRPDQQVEIGSARLFIRLKSDAVEMLAASLWDPDLGLTPVRALLEGKKYKVLGTIGRGGMGVVNQARDLRIHRTVAMKVIKTASQFSRENVLRFIDEAQVTGQLQHPNIVPVYELGLDEHGEVFYTMKFVKGITLEHVLRDIRHGDAETIQKYPLGVLLTVFLKICDGVAYAHSMGVVHRDLKPDNVMIGEYGEVLVMDWGLAKKIAHGSGDENLADTKPQAPESDLRGFQTLDGLIVGTPPFLAPEAARGDLDEIDARSDIYVLGGILYAILTLRPPYPGKEFTELIERIAEGKFVHPSTHNIPSKSDDPARNYTLAHLPGKRVPDGLAAVVVKAMSLKPADRYQNIADLQADITAWQGGFAPKAERAGLGRQILLWAGRNKASVAVFAFFFIVLNAALILFFLSLKHERDNARASERAALESKQQLAEAMQDLQGAAPLFAEQARQLIRQKDLDSALDRVESALRQLPNNADYHLLRANILQTLLRWDDAAEAYETAFTLNPKLTAAKDNLDLTKKLLAALGDEHEPGPAQLRELNESLLRQGRLPEAGIIFDKLGVDRSAPGKALRLAFENDPALGPVREMLDRREFRGRFHRQPGGTFSANFSGLPLATILPFFKAQPVLLTNLTLDGVDIPDLSMLHGMNLTQLSLKGCKNITDLAPLAGMKLQRLNLSGTAIHDITLIADMPLTELILTDCTKLTDITPLRESRQLETLILPAQAREIGFLRKLKNLKFLSYRDISQSAADFWKEREVSHQPGK